MGVLTSLCCSDGPQQNKTQRKYPRPQLLLAKDSSCQLPQPVSNSNRCADEIPLWKSTASQEKTNKVKITLNDFNIKGVLGNGSFGIVYLAQFMREPHTSVHYAIKCLSKDKVKKNEMEHELIIERNVLMESHSNFVCDLKFCFQDEFSFYLGLEYASGGNTYTLISPKLNRREKYKQLGENAVRFIAGCVILGLENLHSNNFMYRDLKPENILIFDNGYLKLTDFGLAEKMQEGKLETRTAGTPIYYAPELVNKQGYTKEIDLWELGVYLYEMSVLSSPWTADQVKGPNFKEIIRREEEQRRWKGADLSKELKDLINNLLRLNPKQRLTLNQVKAHPFFQKLSWDQLINMRIESPLKNIIAEYQIPIKPYHPKPKSNNIVQFDKVQWTYWEREHH